eukprot:4942267-Prymnesium_polylepis.2
MVVAHIGVQHPCSGGQQPLHPHPHMLRRRSYRSNIGGQVGATEGGRFVHLRRALLLLEQRYGHVAVAARTQHKNGGDRVLRQLVLPHKALIVLRDSHVRHVGAQHRSQRLDKARR